MANKVLLLVFIIAICTTFVISDGKKKLHDDKDKDKGKGKGNGHGKDKHKNNGGLAINFYGENCPRAEEIVQTVTERHVSSNPDLPAKLLRVLFHDCFVRVCVFCLLFINDNRIYFMLFIPLLYQFIYIKLTKQVDKFIYIYMISLHVT